MTDWGKLVLTSFVKAALFVIFGLVIIAVLFWLWVDTSNNSDDDTDYCDTDCMVERGHWKKCVDEYGNVFIDKYPLLGPECETADEKTNNDAQFKRNLEECRKLHEETGYDISMCLKQIGK